MSQIVNNTRNVLRALFGVGSQTERESEAWIDTTEFLNPREALLARMTAVLQYGALINAVVVAVMILIAAVMNGDMGGLSGVLIGGLEATAGEALLVAILCALANVGLLLALAVGVQAQEFWTVGVGTIGVIANIAALVVWQYWPGIIALVPVALAGYLSLRDLGAFHGNPVAIKELRGRMRGVRAFAIISIFLILMGTFTVLLYLLQLPDFSGSRTVVTGELGRLLFLGVVGAELVLIIFIVPALTAGAITGERERKTYDLLQTTLLSAPSFLVGKMESALGYIVLLLLSAIPLQSIAFLFGGVSEVEVLVAFVVLVMTGLLLGALGLFFSSQTDRTLTATVRVYTAALAFVFGVPLLALLIFQGAFSSAISGVAAMTNASPAAEAAFIYLDMIAASLNPITAAFYTQQILIDHQVLGLLDVQLASSGATIPIISPWILLAILYLLGTGLLILLAVRRMRRMR